jgi:hypothetical protein
MPVLNIKRKKSGVMPVIPPFSNQLAVRKNMPVHRNTSRASLEKLLDSASFSNTPYTITQMERDILSQKGRCKMIFSIRPARQVIQRAVHAMIYTLFSKDMFSLCS